MGAAQTARLQKGPQHSQHAQGVAGVDPPRIRASASLGTARRSKAVHRLQRRQPSAALAVWGATGTTAGVALHWQGMALGVHDLRRALPAVAFAGLLAYTPGLLAAL